MVSHDPVQTCNTVPWSGANPCACKTWFGWTAGALPDHMDSAGPASSLDDDIMLAALQR